MKKLKLAGTTFFPLLLWLPFHKGMPSYIDPGTGSIVVQAVIGIFAAMLIGAGIYWRKIRTASGNLLGRLKKRGKPQQ